MLLKKARRGNSTPLAYCLWYDTHGQQCCVRRKSVTSRVRRLLSRKYLEARTSVSLAIRIGVSSTWLPTLPVSSRLANGPVASSDRRCELKGLLLGQCLGLANGLVYNNANPWRPVLEGLILGRCSEARKEPCVQFSILVETQSRLCTDVV